MAKQKISNYVCNDCGADFTKWQGQCSECSAWNTLTEIRLSGSKKTSSHRYTGFAGTTNSSINTLSDIDINEIHKLCFLDRKELFTPIQLKKFSNR